MTTIRKEKKKQWCQQHYSMLCPIYEVNMKLLSKGSSNQLSKTHQSINEILTARLQRYVILRYERHRKSFFLDINDMVVQIFPGMITTIFFEEIETVTFLLSQNVE
jgi:hypothetical protein